MELSRVLAQPDRFRDTPLSFVIQFRQLGRHEQAFFTKFDPENWQSLVAWPDDSPLWEKKAYESDFRQLFVKRGSPEARAFAQATPYKRFRISGTITHVLKGQPWIEVTSVEDVPGQVTEASLVHLVKGLLLRDLRRFESAAREFQAADAETLPKQVRLLCIREEALAILEAGRPAAAEKRLLAAFAIAPEDPTSSVALAHIRAAAARSPEDVPVAVRENGPARPDSRPVAPTPPSRKD